MSKRLEKNNDYQILFQIKDKIGKVISLSYFSDYEVVLLNKEGDEIRTYKTSQTVTKGKLYEYDSDTLEFYIETRDTDTNDFIEVRVKTQWAESKLADGVFNNNKLIDEYKFE